MSIESEEEDKADTTVYQLAEQMALGMPLSPAASIEVATELLRVRDAIRDFAKVYRHTMPTLASRLLKIVDEQKGQG